MRDPHVQQLIFTITPTGRTSFVDPPLLEFTNQLGDFALADGTLTVTPVADFPTADAARALIEPFLRAWEIDADLRLDPGTIRFTYSHADIIDRDPPPPDSSGNRVVNVAATAMGVATVSASIGRANYPRPPAGFQLTDDVRSAHWRWFQYRHGREPLPGMAYFVLTIFKSRAGGLSQAANTFQIDIAVLRAIGELSTLRGDEETARKHTGSLRALTDSEERWLDGAVKLLIRRLGEQAAGDVLKRLTMDDLPPLR